MTFQPPTIEEAKEYATSIGYTTFNPVAWWHHYNKKGWIVGKVKMSSWKSAVWTWFVGTFEWRELQRKKNETKKDVQRQRDTYTDYIQGASAIKLKEMLKAPEWERIYWLIKELRPEIKGK
jgi:hypothetical protein